MTEGGCDRSRQPPPNGARQSASQSLPACSPLPNSPIQSLPPRGSCRAATEGEAPNRANLGRRTASACGSSHSGEPPPNGARRSRSQSLPAWSRPPNNPIQSLPPRGSCRAATEGEAPSPASLGRRTASACGSSHSRQPPPNGARQSASQSLPACSPLPNNPIQSLPPRGSCRAATEGEAPNRANLGRRTASACGSSHSGEPPPNGARRSRSQSLPAWSRPPNNPIQSLPPRGSCRAATVGEAPNPPAWAAARPPPPPAAAPPRGSHRRTERADLGAKACQPGVAPRTPDPIAPPEGELSRSD